MSFGTARGAVSKNPRTGELRARFRRSLTCGRARGLDQVLDVQLELELGIPSDIRGHFPNGCRISMRARRMVTLPALELLDGRLADEIDDREPITRVMDEMLNLASQRLCQRDA